MKAHVLATMTVVGMATGMLGCLGSSDETTEVTEEPLFLTGTSYDTSSTCTVGGITMHCCPGNDRLNTFHSAMTGAHLGSNTFKCGQLNPQNTAAPFLDLYTSRQGVHACPPGSVMAGFHAGRNALACVPFAQPLTETLDSGTSDGFMHVCPGQIPHSLPTQVMSGIHVGANKFLCAHNP